MISALARASAIDPKRPNPGRFAATSRRGGASGRAGCAAQAGSVDAVEALFRATGGAPTGPRSIVHDPAAAEDIAQEAFLAALRALHRFDRRRPFGPWFHRIVVNRAIDWSRARALRGEVDEMPDRGSPVANSRTSTDEIAPALGPVARGHRAVVVLRYLLGYSTGGVAKLLGVPRGTVNSRLRRGLDQLAGELGAQR